MQVAQRTRTEYVLQPGVASNELPWLSERNSKVNPQRAPSLALPSCALVCLVLLLSICRSKATESWQGTFHQMPLQTDVQQLNRSNCVAVMLAAFRSNEVVKALIFMPGATDELYMFRRVRASLTNMQPTLLDAVSALTNQTFIRATFRSPFLLLHNEEDHLEPLVNVESDTAVKKLQKKHALPHLEFNDADWDQVQPVLAHRLHVDVRPYRFRPESWHFYRHSLAGWDMTGWEALEAVALANRTSFTIQRAGLLTFPRTQVSFVPDRRVGTAPRGYR